MNFAKQKDLLFGNKNECILLDEISSHFKINLTKLGQMHPFDFRDADSTMYIELKSRRCNFDTYSDTMVSYNKIKYIHDHPERKYYFVFSFIDGVYYIEYDKQLFENFRVNRGGRCDRGEPEYKQYLFIPIEQLQQIKTN